MEERHHIIPRAAGGEDGPVVSLCEKHHKKLHLIALRLKSKKPYFDLLHGEAGDSSKKILWLASKVYNAFELTKDDPNKAAVVLFSLDQRRQLMIDQLKKVYPNLKSREAILSLALESLYNRHFIKEQ